MIRIPMDRAYSKEHVWAQETPEGYQRIGITDYARHLVGRAVYVELPNTGDAFDADARIGAVESDDAVTEFTTPVAGVVAAVNVELSASPGLVHDEPYDSGWLVEIDPAHPDDTGHLLSAAAYEEYLHDEAP